MSDVERAADLFAVHGPKTADLPETERLTMYQIAIRHGFLAGAAWQREQDAKLADERKLMRLRLAEEHPNKDGQYYNHVRAQEASDISDEIRAQGSNQEGKAK